MAISTRIILFCLFFVPGKSFAQDDVNSSSFKAPKVSDPTTQEILEEEPTPNIRRRGKNADVEQLKNPSTRYIEHPNAEKGLFRITKDKQYLYKVKSSPQEYTASIRLGMYKPDQLQNPKETSINFDDVYTQSDVPMLHYEHEYQFYKKFGRMAFTVGFGFYYAEGQGVFDPGADTPSEGEALEKYQLFVFPITAGLNYRFQYWENQWVVPYVGGGIAGFFVAEVRDDGENSDLGAALGVAPAAFFTGGLTIPLGRDSRSFLDLDREYGINSMSVVAEYRRFENIGSDFDFSSDFIGGGIHVEY